jgi:DNA-binding transcriptional LysR family regulator
MQANFNKLFSQSGLSLERLRTLCELEAAGSYARMAPDDRGRQSLFSRQISELEEFFGGIELVKRSGRGIEITKAGRELARSVRLHFEDLVEFLEANTLQGAEFHIAAGSSFLEWMAIPRLVALRKKYPELSFRFSGMRSNEIAEALREHRVDFGLVRANTVSHPLKQRDAGTVEYRIYGPAGLSPDDLLKRPLAMRINGEFHSAIEDLAAKARVQLQVAYECQSFSQCAILVMQGAAVSILPNILPPHMKDLPSCQPPWLKKYSRKMAVAWRIRTAGQRKGRLARLVEEALAGKVV